ncbi:MAG: cytochrome c [Bacteroidales bacterium]|nr:cytochrome c [Bacteroidales bacterium]MDZ4205207.1 cytochrome c [Bacteroidales bacterium]
MKTKSMIFFFGICIMGISMIGLTVPQAQQQIPEPWPVPENFKKMKNPVDPANKEMATLGRNAYNKHCRSCHGNKGLGDGPRAASLKTFPGDFSSAEFQKFPDGEHFYRTNVGRGEMPAYEKTIPDVEERWAIVNFMRTFKK